MTTLGDRARTRRGNGNEKSTVGCGLWPRWTCARTIALFVFMQQTAKVSLALLYP